MERKVIRVGKGKLVNRGKTKKIYRCVKQPNWLIMKALGYITAHDDPSWTREFPSKARYATTTTCRIFELLQAAGIPVAYQGQVEGSDSEFVADWCEMIGLEVIARRKIEGSFLKRRPDLKGLDPNYLRSLLIEFFLKTTGGKYKRGGKTILKGMPMIPAKKGKKPLDDPFIKNHMDTVWRLCDPKKPSWEDGYDLDKTIVAADVLYPENIEVDRDYWTQVQILATIEEITRRVFLVLEAAWGSLGYRLKDFKLEFGWTKDGRLVLADVIDNDSWRIEDPSGEEMSKERFRQGNTALDYIEQLYGTIAAEVGRFAMPKQVLVIWRGSTSDLWPKPPDYKLSNDFGPCEVEVGSSHGCSIPLEDEEIDPGYPEVDVIYITGSGHKETERTLKKLKELELQYPGGGVIVVKVGRSNGLGPILATHTTWPVYSVPADAKSSPQNIASHLAMPSQCPMGTFLYENNGIQAALQVLAKRNPALAMMLRYDMEELDPDTVV